MLKAQHFLVFFSTPEKYSGSVSIVTKISDFYLIIPHNNVFGKNYSKLNPMTLKLQVQELPFVIKMNNTIFVFQKYVFLSDNPPPPPKKKK